jgi:hypothetical protein
LELNPKGFLGGNENLGIETCQVKKKGISFRSEGLQFDLRDPKRNLSVNLLVDNSSSDWDCTSSTGTADQPTATGTGSSALEVQLTLILSFGTVDLINH